MALPFLTAEHIPHMFVKLEEKASTPALWDLVAYVRTTWIDSAQWPPSAWTCFMQAIRTNNDVEGWHHRLNRHAPKSSLPFYLLINLLHEEARLISIQLRLLDEDKVRRHQRTTYKALLGKVLKYWDEFNQGEQKAKRLLRACSHLNGSSGQWNGQWQWCPLIIVFTVWNIYVQCDPVMGETDSASSILDSGLINSLYMLLNWFYIKWNVP